MIMSKPNLNDALENVEMIYSDISDIASDMTTNLFTPINNLVSSIREDINNLSVGEIREYLLRLQLRAYELSEIKDKSGIKAECAEALRKEKFARSFNEASGSAAVKDNIALIESSEEVVVEALYNLVANLVKTKCDQLHRLIDTLKSILVSRMQEAKMTSMIE